jgi:hypothetical protein
VVQSETFPLVPAMQAAHPEVVHQLVSFRLPSLPGKDGGLVLLIHANQEHGRDYHVEGHVALLPLQTGSLHSDNEWQSLTIPLGDSGLQRPKIHLSATGATPFYIAEAVYFPDHLPTGADLRAAPGTLLRMRQVQPYGLRDLVGRVLAAHGDFPNVHHTLVEMPNGQHAPPPFAQPLLGGFNDALMRGARPLGSEDVSPLTRDNGYSWFVDAIPANSHPDIVLVALDTATAPSHGPDFLVAGLKDLVQRANALPVLVLASLSAPAAPNTHQAWKDFLSTVQQDLPGLPIIDSNRVRPNLSNRHIAYDPNTPAGKAWLQAALASGFTELRARLVQAVNDVRKAPVR